MIGKQETKPMDPKFKLTKNQMLIEAVEYYIYSMKQDNCNQAAIDVYTELLNELEVEEEE